jgi:hypothetical protein
MTIYSKIRRPGQVTRRAQDTAGSRRSAAVPTVRATRRRSLALGAAVLVAAAMVGGAGGAGAAGLLTGKNIRDDSLRSADFRDGSIGAAKIRDGGLSQTDVGFDLTGDQGAPGDPGPPGSPGIRSITYRTGAPQSSNTAGALDAVANCFTGEIALSGGAQLDAADPGTRPYILWSTRNVANGWRTFIAGPAGFKQYTPWVVCAKVS